MDVVIIGAGQAGIQVALSLRQQGHDGRIAILGAEPHAPYQRPPLSKAYLKGEATQAQLSLRPAEALAGLRIDLHTNSWAVSIDRASRRVACGESDHHYDRLVFATGTRPRLLPVPGARLPGVLTLRNIEDADRLRAALDQARNAVIIGGGFIGLEAAATIRARGKPVTVIEAAPRVMARAVAPQVSHWFEAMHRGMGTELRCGVGVSALMGRDHVEAVELSDGETMTADVVLVGVGALPNTDLAEAAGLSCPNGIATDAQGRTADPHVFAAGDCALTPSPWTGSPIRLESVQNAIDQAKTVAAAIMGQDVTYDAVPWFWSDQGAAKLQTTGLPVSADAHVLRGDPGDGRFTVFHLRNGTVIAADSVNAAADHMFSRRLVAARAAIPAAVLADTAMPLKSLIP
jgi:3-phenylpropionate/trans-cinnamate dioxygenase ferredoxin reductase component